MVALCVVEVPTALSSAAKRLLANTQQRLDRGLSKLNQTVQDPKEETSNLENLLEVLNFETEPELSGVSSGGGLITVPQLICELASDCGLTESPLRFIADVVFSIER